jgi:hypothetical protein
MDPSIDGVRLSNGHDWEEALSEVLLFFFNSSSWPTLQDLPTLGLCYCQLCWTRRPGVLYAFLFPFWLTRGKIHCIPSRSVCYSSYCSFPRILVHQRPLNCAHTLLSGFWEHGRSVSNSKPCNKFGLLIDRILGSGIAFRRAIESSPRFSTVAVRLSQLVCCTALSCPSTRPKVRRRRTLAIKISHSTTSFPVVCHPYLMNKAFQQVWAAN